MGERRRQLLKSINGQICLHWLVRAAKRSLTPSLQTLRVLNYNWCECRIHTAFAFLVFRSKWRDTCSASSRTPRAPLGSFFYMFINWPCLIMNTSGFIFRSEASRCVRVEKKLKMPTLESCKSLSKAAAIGWWPTPGWTPPPLTAGDTLQQTRPSLDKAGTLEE